MEEALDLEGDLARWQLLCKAPFPNTNDSRVAHRLEDDQWAWYYRTALRTVIQGCGRVVRAPDDYGATYLADSSLLDLFDRAKMDMPDWFREQVDRMERPDLPAFGPDDAAGGRGGRSRSSESRTSDGGTTSGSGSGGGASDANASSTSGSSSGRSEKKSPISDVWDVE
jgi:uncharacterized membrane protein YgcG